MAELHAARRNRLAKSSFGIPGERKYPMPDASHAQNAKGRARQMLNAGRMSHHIYTIIIAKANRKLGKGHHAS